MLSTSPLSFRRRLANRAVVATTVAALSATAVGASQAQANPVESLATQAQTVELISRASLAVARAHTLAGKAYRRGGLGPNSYDCSGSTLTAWRAAGVELPRVPRDQYLHLTPGAVRVPLSERQAGDLVFYSRSPGNPDRIYHVAILVDRDNVLNAGRRGLRVQPLYLNRQLNHDLMPMVVRPAP